MKNITEKQIIDKIGYYMNLRKMSAYKLGYMIGHAKTYFYRIQSGEIHLTIDTFLEILDILEVSTTEFFGSEINVKDKEILNEISKLSDENKQTILMLSKKLH